MKKNYLIVKLLCSIVLFAMPTVMVYGQNDNETTVTVGSFVDNGNDDKGGKVLKAKKVDDLPASVNNEDRVFDVVEQMPEFPGGQTALMEYLSKNVKYPATAQENGIQGRVIVTFIVEKDGSVNEVEVVKSVDPALDREAVRVVSEMPTWNPGRQNGEPIRVKYNIPISFSLGTTYEKPQERYYRLANEYAEQGDIAMAVSYSDKAVDLCFDDATLFQYSIQNVYLHYELWATQAYTEEQTRKLLNKINDLEQEVEALVATMTAARDNEGPSEAIDRMIAWMNDLSVNLTFSRGQLRYFLGDIQSAIADFTTAIDSNPEDVEMSSALYRCRGYCYSQQGQKTLAEKDYKEVIKIEEGAGTWRNANFAYLVLGDTKKAIAITDEILSRGTTTADNYYSAATLFALIGDKDKALQYLEKAFEEGYNHFGWIHWDDQLDAIRDTPEFKSLVNKYEE